MSVSFPTFASRYYAYARQTQGRLLEWHEAQAEASDLYERYKTTYTGDLHSQPCDQWFEQEVGNGKCVRTVGRSRPPSVGDLITTTPHPVSTVKNRIEQWRKARVSRKRLLEREHQRTYRLTTSFREQRAALEARVRELTDLVAAKDAELQTALQAESESWNAHEEALEQLQTFLHKGHEKVESTSVEQDELVDDFDAGKEEDAFRSQMNKLESETHEQLKRQRAAYAELQKQLSDANDRLFQTEDQRQMLYAELIELQTLQQHEHADLAATRDRETALRDELLRHTKASTQEAQTLKARIKTLEAQIASHEDDVYHRKDIREREEQRNALVEEQLQMQSKLTAQRDAEIARLRSTIDETQALLSSSRQDSVKRNALVSNLQHNIMRLSEELAAEKESVARYKYLQKRDQDRAAELQRRVDASMSRA